MRAAVYCRISDDRTGQAAGVQRQEADATALCVRRGWEVVETIVDNDLSASRYSRKARPGYLRLMGMIAAGEVDVIAAYHVDRLYRRPAELEDLIDLAESTLIATCEGEFRLDTSDGRAMARVIAAMAAKSSDDSSRRVKRKHLELAEAGLPVGGGRRPFGFDVDRRTVRPDEAARLQEAAARVLAGESLSAVCRDWNTRRVPSVGGGRWESSALRRMLEAPRVAGLRSLSGQVVGVAVWPAIIDRDTWDRLRLVISSNAPTMPDGYQARTYLLSGLVVCQQCGVKMTAHPLTVKGRKVRRYFCLRSRGGCNAVGISADRLENLIMVEGLMRQAPKVDPIPPATVDEAGFALRRATSDLDALADQLAQGVLSAGAYAAAATAVDRRVEALRRDARRTLGRGALAELQASEDPRARWDAFDWSRRRAVLVDALVRVDIAPAEHRGVGFDPSRVTPVWR